MIQFLKELKVMSQANDFNHENHLYNTINGLNYMKSSMTQSDTERDDYNPCEIHVTIKKQIINT